MKKLILISIFLLTYSFNSFADNSYFLNYAKVLNSSKPGAAAQKKLQEKFQSESKKFNELEKKIRKEESEIINQKKILSAEDYQKKVEALRKKVSNLQKNKQTSFNSIAKSRSEAKELLIKAVNPILKKYMEDNNIRVVLDKKIIILGDTHLEITEQIIAILNKELPSIKIN